MTAAERPVADAPEGRWFTDAQGRPRRVVEERIACADWSSADDESHRAGYAVGWLHFTSAETRRRLRLFPRDWHALPDAALERLCRRALHVRPGP